MKPLIVGEAPSKNEHPPSPIAGRIGRRLAECCDLTLEQFLDHFERVNLLDVRQDTKEKGFEFDREAARVRAIGIKNEQPPDRVVILLGFRVARAFEVEPNLFVHQTGWGPNFRWSFEIRVVPHPSGVNRWYNDPTIVAQMQNFMRTIVRRTS